MGVRLLLGGLDLLKHLEGSEQLLFRLTMLCELQVDRAARDEVDRMEQLAS